jgi:hypothetical protein
MSDLTPHYDVTRRDLARGRNLLIGAVSAPLVLGGVPAIVFLALTLLLGSTPPVAATFLFLGIIVTVIGFVLGLATSGFLAYRRSRWSAAMRERIAADGIKAEEIEWFRHELRTAEKTALRQISQRDLLLEDAYRETLASRLTASRIVRSSKKEMLQLQRRRQKLKHLRSKSSPQFVTEVERDIEQFRSINDEAKQMLAEAETRLQMIEAAAVRGSSLADSELALKKLSARTAQLPLALESAKMAEEIRRELDAHDSGSETQ